MTGPDASDSTTHPPAEEPVEAPLPGGDIPRGEQPPGGGSATEPLDPQPRSHVTQEAPNRLAVATAATRDPDDATSADQLVAIAPPGKPDGEVDTRPR